MANFCRRRFFLPLASLSRPSSRPSVLRPSGSKEDSGSREAKSRGGILLLIAFLLPSLSCLQKNEQGYEEYRNEKDGSILIKIPAGEFWMGSPPGEGQDDEHPQHKVYLSEYFIGKYEVTNEQYKKFCDATGYSRRSDPGFKGMENYFIEYPNYPVVNVSWEDAAAYVTWAGLRLPTEAEWEKGARGADAREHPWGDEEPDEPNAGGFYRCNYAGTGDGYEYTAPVGSYDRGRSPYGCMDMAGNVWEWCGDWYDKNYYSLGAARDKGRAPDRNPQGPNSGASRVVRGGGWFGGSWHLRSARRRGLHPSVGFSTCGFRVAASP